jgi:DNA-directed RNA polymerase specialized sigma subunit
MTPKQYLHQIAYLDRRIDHDLEICMRLRSKLERCTAVLTGMPRGGKPLSIEDVLDKIDRIEQRMNADTDKLVDMTYDAYLAINCVDNDNQREVLTRLYLEGQSLDDIAEDLGYSRRQVERIHGMGLLKVTVPNDGRN